MTTAKAGPGLNAVRLVTVKDKSGSLQVADGEMPLYYFAGDTAPSQLIGKLTDEWGNWFVVVTVKPARSGGHTGRAAPINAETGGVAV